MFTVLKIRKGIKTYDDPGWYDHPKGTVSYKVGEVEKKKFQPRNMIIKRIVSRMIDVINPVIMARTIIVKMGVPG